MPTTNASYRFQLATENKNKPIRLSPKEQGEVIWKAKEMREDVVAIWRGSSQLWIKLEIHREEKEKAADEIVECPYCERKIPVYIKDFENIKVDAIGWTLWEPILKPCDCGRAILVEMEWDKYYSIGVNPYEGYEEDNPWEGYEEDDDWEF